MKRFLGECCDRICAFLTAALVVGCAAVVLIPVFLVVMVELVCVAIVVAAACLVTPFVALVNPSVLVIERDPEQKSVADERQEAEKPKSDTSGTKS